MTSMCTKIRKVAKLVDIWLNLFISWFCIIIFGLIFLIVVIQITYRFAFGKAFRWAEELVRYLCLWGAFVGGGLAIRKNYLIGVSTFFDRVPDSIKNLLSHLQKIAGIIFLVFIIRYSKDLISLAILRDQLSPAMRVPIYWAYLALPAGALVMIIFVLLSYFE